VRARRLEARARIGKRVAAIEAVAVERTGLRARHAAEVAAGLLLERRLVLVDDHRDRAALRRPDREACASLTQPYRSELLIRGRHQERRNGQSAAFPGVTGPSPRSRPCC